MCIRDSQYVGRVFTLEAPVVNGYGKIRVDDSTWKVAVNQDCPAGAKLRIVDADVRVVYAARPSAAAAPAEPAPV